MGLLPLKRAPGAVADGGRPTSSVVQEYRFPTRCPDHCSTSSAALGCERIGRNGWQGCVSGEDPDSVLHQTQRRYAGALFFEYRMRSKMQTLGALRGSWYDRL